MWAYVKPLRPVRGPAFITKTNTSRASVPLASGSPDPRHLHNQQFQPSRADSSGGKGGCACWGASCPGPMLASGLAAPPPRAASLTGVIVRSSLSCWLPHPHPSAPTQAPAAKQNTPQAPHPRHQGGSSCGRSRKAPRCLGAQMPALPSLAPRQPPQEGQASTLQRHSPGTTPPRAGELPKGGKKGSPRVERTGPWRKGKAQDRRGLKQAALRVVRSPEKGIIGGLGGRGEQ